MTFLFVYVSELIIPSTFIFESNGKIAIRSTNKVYTSINGSSVSKNDLNSEYLFAYTITDIDDSNAVIKVTPYATDLSGNKITFESAICTLSTFDSGITMLSADSYNYSENDFVTSNSAIEIDVISNSDSAASKADNEDLPLVSNIKKEIPYIDDEEENVV